MKVIATTLAVFAVLNLVLLSTADTPSEAKPVEAALNATTTLSNATIEVVQSLENAENASVEVDSSPKLKSDELPAPVFPENSDKNETALQILLNKTSSAADSEATAQLNKTVVLTQPEGPSNNSSTTVEVANSDAISVNSTAPVGNSTINDTSEEDYDEPEKNDAENIQEGSDQQQNELEEEFGRNGSEKATIKLFEDPITSKPVLHSGHFALIFASTLIILSILAYVGLVLWRGRLEQRYGNGRQRLVTEDDYYNNNDVRYFGL